MVCKYSTKFISYRNWASLLLCLSHCRHFDFHGFSIQILRQI